MKKNQITEAKRQTEACRKTTIGGQALIEGLMMIGPEKKAMAVRKADGSIWLEELPLTRFSRAAKIPFLRGSVRLFRQLVSGTKALLRSAELVEEEPADGDRTADHDATAAADSRENSGTKQKAPGFFERFAEKHADLMLYLSAALGILLSVALFILLPNLITSFIRQLTGLQAAGGAGMTILLNLIEGLIRITLFIAYLVLATRMKDIKRVWMYHGAEHKTIACYEAQMNLTVDNVREFSRFHPRCGTAFLFIVILVSIIVFSFVGWWGRWVNLLIRFALVPLVAGIAYEIIRLAGRYDNRLTRTISAPGLWLQRLTTAEPDDSMLEVAIAAMNAVRPLRVQEDQW